MTSTARTIGAGVFIGSDAALVAPVTVGDGAFVGAGSVITEDVAPDALALGRGRQVQKPNRAAEMRAAKRKEPWLMCGIVGVIGARDAAPLLLDALRRLEYRGYDSAGIATLVNGHIDRRRAEGKLGNLAAALDRAAAARHHRHRPHPMGHPRRADREQRAPARHRARVDRA